MSAISKYDRKLIMLAAKAAGIKSAIICDAYPEEGFRSAYAKIGKRTHWRPLDDNDDCFSLAMACDIDIEFDAVERRTIARHSDGEKCIQYWDGLVPGKEEATRRAVVRAAADIERAKG